ncbi:conserved hypothetical protein [Alteracholeplasma palmae J233]|uniref:Exonuclease domain-containing protein n=1 Tax=Alteracholeplasma palmae (strain ATCC 49389 / J233) TaxID=1318466 RepID=U4KPQ7_ALTPJ|nr:hypothetical protein [Alteracholeplasma palmae]CCV64265.1 conserved hypothetical protein [Alteracholeplasma palmae J233]
MKYQITEVDYTNKVFYCIVNGKKEMFYLPNRLSKVFMEHLEEGMFASFTVLEKRKKHLNQYAYQISYFTQIVSYHPRKRVLYDLENLRSQMRQVVKQYSHFLFIDFEMTMPHYHQKEFKPELIQTGYVLTDAAGNTILEDGYYILPVEKESINKRTKKFLQLDEDLFFEKAVPYANFYEKLKKIIKDYRPQLVVWGKNDITALQESYDLHKVKRITNDKSFIDLLKLHKDYFNLKDDIGLFKAYKLYYDKNEFQVHDAKVDASVTKYVFDAFLKQMK